MNPEKLEPLINEALSEPCPVLCNLKITLAHQTLSEALSAAIGLLEVANFHSWAVWGSKKAGVTVRQEDLETALKDATRVAGICGATVGHFAAKALSSLYPWWGRKVGSVAGVGLGASVGAWCGRGIARWSRIRASKLVLAGNKLVLDDIGRRTARFCAVRAAGKSDIVEGSDELLEQAFYYYALAADSNNTEERHQASYYANCLAILHEHLKLQPYIEESMPFIVRRCVTKRMLEFNIGAISLQVSEDLPTVESEAYPETLANLKLVELNKFLATWRRPDLSTAANDWTKLKDRMAYIVELFRWYHLDPSVREAPYSQRQRQLIEGGEIPHGEL